MKDNEARDPYAPVPAGPPKIRRNGDQWEIWAGEGTGWVPYHGRKPPG